MEITLSVIGFGLLVIAALIVFAWKKLQPLSKETVCICQPQDEEGKIISCGRFKEIYANFTERRNEFWCFLGQFAIIIVIITLIVVLLLLDKISSEAALPIIAGLGSFAAGKGITSINKFSKSDDPTSEKTGARN